MIMEKPTTKRKEREKEARREAILKAAARVFSKKNYYEATLDEIAAEAELAKGTLYNYYKDKLDLFLSLVDGGTRQFQSELDRAYARGGTLQELLTRCFETSLQVVRDHKYMYRMMTTAGAHLSEQVRSEVIENWHNQILIAARKLADIMASNPETSRLSEAERLAGAQLVFSAIHILHHRQMIENISGTMQEEIDNFVRLLCRALNLEQTT
jgi:AcrR family transcriptional regulator